MSIDPKYATRVSPDAKIRRIAATHSSFTSGEVAKICGVAPRTVSQRWFDGLQAFPNGYKIPGCLDRRIPRQDLIDFCIKHRIVAALDLLQAKSKIRVVGAGASSGLTEVLSWLLRREQEVSVVLCQDSFDLAQEMTGLRLPDLLVCDRLIDKSAVRKAVALIAGTRKDRKQEKNWSHTVVVLADGDMPDLELPEWVVQGQASDVLNSVQAVIAPAILRIAEVA